MRLKRLCICVFSLVLLFVSTFSFGLQPVYKTTAFSVTNFSVQSTILSSNPFSKIKDFFIELFSGKKKTVSNENSDKTFVYLGGNCIGFSICSDGVVVVGISDVDSGERKFSPATNANIKPGDIIKKIDDIKITSAEKIGEILASGQKSYRVEILRNDTIIFIDLIPAFDVLTSTYKMGLWVRDNSSGVGTLTFTKEDGSFVALGHSVADIDTGINIPIGEGFVYRTNIIGVTKGRRGEPGELKGVFVKSDRSVGTLIQNTNHGLLGKFEHDDVKKYSNTFIEVAKSCEVVPGKATMFSCIEGGNVEGFEIEIVKVNKSSNEKNKNMVVRIIDENLLNKCGGIVQGMSGSPIVQNGKLVGGLTHVFVNDPTKGYAIFAENMM